MNTQKEIKRLTGIWYKYVGFDHHKDRDCHWYIETTYSYGEDPVYYVLHHGYVGESVKVKCGTYETAEQVLLKEVKKAILKAQEHARAVLSERTPEWGQIDVEAAEYILDQEV